MENKKNDNADLGKTPVQADGHGSAKTASIEATGHDGAGESGGGAYPNPHTGKDGNTGRARDQGGQSIVTERLPKK